MIFLKKMPVDPGSFVILTVSVVISVFGVSEFVTCKEHRSSTAGHENCTGIADHAEAERKNFRVGGVTFFTTVPAAVVVGTVSIVPAVCFVVFLIVGIKIIHGEAIVAGKELTQELYPA